MSHLRIVVLLLFILVWVPGCDIGRGCTDIGVSAELAVSSDSNLGPEITSLKLKACSNGKCWKAEVHLHRETRDTASDWIGSIDTGTSALGSEIQVSGSYQREGESFALPEVTIPLNASYPNGKDCEPAWGGGAVRVTPSGLQDATP